MKTRFLEKEKQEIIHSLLPYRIYLSKPNANAKIQYFLYKYLQREASIEAFNFCKLAADQGHIAALFRLAIKNEAITSQIIGWEKPLKASFIVKVFVKSKMVRAENETPP